MKTVITAARLFTPTEKIESPFLVIEDGKVLAISSRRDSELPASGRHLDFPGMVLAPGLIDIHIHGGAGHDVMEADSQALAAIEKHLVRTGVTGYLATTVTAPRNRLAKALDYLGKQAASPRQSSHRANLLGIHLEGPFISHAKCGVHPQEDLVEPSPQLFDSFREESHGRIRLITIAPELAGAAETIRHAKNAGVCCSLGHSNATFAEALHGIAAGATHATHTFNAMRTFDHREPGILGAVLTEEALTADIIADGIHTADAALKLFFAAKGPERAILITDAISATGMPDGRYKLGAMEVDVKNGRCEYQGRLAGSVLTLDQAVRNVTRFTSMQLPQALRMATLNPASLLGISSQRGTLMPGSIADVVVLTPAGEVMQVFLAGDLTYSRT
jgi:N-acetylglucosamine-6-phosphate deacetylase